MLKVLKTLPINGEDTHRVSGQTTLLEFEKKYIYILFWFPTKTKQVISYALCHVFTNVHKYSNC